MQPDTSEFWIDLNLPPHMAMWLREDFDVDAKSFKELNFDNVSDLEVYKIAAARTNTIIITTKDIDFINFQEFIGAPPKILYINVGNISNKELKSLILNKFADILQLFLKSHNALIEISNM